MKEPQWPMTAESFLKQGLLKRTDIVLCNNRKTLSSWLIRFGTKSRFSHAALMFLIPNYDKGFEKSFVIEAASGGVDITDLGHYAIELADTCDVAILRLNAEWLDEETQRLIRGRMLNYIKSEYDFASIWQITKSVVVRMLFGIQVSLRGLKGAVERSQKKKKLVPGQFICSGFVQYGYYDVVAELVAQGKLPEAALGEVRFARDMPAEPSSADLLTVTPEDIAECDSLSWQYVIVDGMAHKVSTRREAYHLFDHREPDLAVDALAP